MPRPQTMPPMKVSVPKEAASGERRVALVPEVVERLSKGGIEVVVEAGAGEAAHHPDAAYEEAGATLGDGLLGRRGGQGGAAVRRRDRPARPAARC